MSSRVKEVLARPVFKRLNDWDRNGPIPTGALEDFAEALRADMLDEIERLHRWKSTHAPRIEAGAISSIVRHRLQGDS
jgi:hypothetical protein